MLLGEVLHALFSYIDRPQNFRVFWLETFEHVSKASAHLVLNFRRWLSRCLQFACPGLKSFFSGNMPPMVVNHEF
jgi:hypothetical protein